MVIGEYPCCGAPFMIEVPDKTPAFFKEECSNCGVVVWHKLSRWDPESWVESEFLKLFEIKGRSIKPRGLKTTI